MYHRIVPLVVASALLVIGLDAAPRPAASGGPPALAPAALAPITPPLVKAHVRFLSHDLLRGRGTGDVGYELAREHVVAQFARLGLKPWDGSSYLQQVDLLEGARDLGSSLTANGITVRESDARFAPSFPSGSARWEGEAMYVRYGLTTHGENDYAGLEVRGKAVIMLAGAPDDWRADRDWARAAAARVEIALRKGAAAVIELNPSVQPAVGSQGVLVLADGTSPRPRPDAVVAGEAARRLLVAWGIGASPAATPPRPVGHLTLVRHHEVKPVKSWNIIGIVPGADPTRRDESIVYTAHLDHLGIVPADEQGDTICNGTHDNAIGTAELLAAAEAVAKLKPARSIIFAVVGAEERGLLGSWYYVRHPPLPLEKTVANINLDGGRDGAETRDVIPNAADTSDLEEIVTGVMAESGTGITYDRSPTAVAGFSSDHYCFLLAGVPAVDLKPGYDVSGDSERGWRERLTYFNTLRHRPADNFSDAFTFESAAQMAGRTVALAWRLSEAVSLPQLKPAHAVARPRGVPLQPWYFGPAAAAAAGLTPRTD